MKKVYCIGELLIDFVAENQGADLSKAKQFTKKAGGAPANVATAIAKLGGKSELVGCIGNDAFGDFLKETLKTNRVGLTYLERSPIFTTLAFVSLAKNGERDFVFSRGADRELSYIPFLANELKGEIVHFGAATAFLGGSLEETYHQYLQDALQKNAFISFDPNFRIDLWRGKESIFREKCLPFVQKCHFAKFSDEEALLISQANDLGDACSFFHGQGTPIIAITLGKEGTLLSNGIEKTKLPSIPVKAVDTTGAGDAFVGCFLYQLSRLESIEKIRTDFTLLKELVAIANKAGAITTTKFGAIDALPKANEVGL